MNLIPYKQWATEEAQRRHVHISTICHRVLDGEYPNLRREFKNQRVVMVPPYPVARIVMAKPDRRIKYDFSKVDWANENVAVVARRMGCTYQTARNARNKSI